MCNFFLIEDNAAKSIYIWLFIQSKGNNHVVQGCLSRKTVLGPDSVSLASRDKVKHDLSRSINIIQDQTTPIKTKQEQHK